MNNKNYKCLFIIFFAASMLCAQSLITGLTAKGHDSRIDLVWQPVSVAGFQGYNIYRSSDEFGSYTKLNSSPHQIAVYSDFIGNNLNSYWYYVTPVTNGYERQPSTKVMATPYAMTDQQLLTSVEEATFRFFWNFAHPVSGLTRDYYSPDDITNTCAVGGTGMGLMVICIGAERGFVTRAEAAAQTLKIINFLQNGLPRYHGAWAHFADGATGQTLPLINPNDNGADLVETAYVAQGLLTVRKYFNADEPAEQEIRTKATALWEEIDWYWFLRRSEPEFANNETLFWHWSPDFGWAMNAYVVGYNECMITYLLAIASPTHPIPASCFYNGWAGGNYKNGNSYYGIKQWVGGFESCMFFVHYTFMGFDPRNKYDKYCNYFENSTAISLIDRAYCIDNPKGFADYNEFVWGLTASYNPWGYGAHAPGNPDNGTISPTASLSSMPYTPDESLATLKFLYHNYGDQVWNEFGFVDAFNPNVNWFSSNNIAIDQGPIAVMIENQRTNLCWDLFMSNSEISTMLDKIGWATKTDNGLEYEFYQGTWDTLPDFDLLTPVAKGLARDFDISSSPVEDHFAFRFKGFIEISAAGGYTFYTRSDDGSKLYIDGQLVVSNDGLHGIVEQSGYKYLSQGRHQITVTYFEKDGSQDLLVSWLGPDISKTQIPVGKLYRCNIESDLNHDCKIDFGDLKMLADGWLNNYTFLDFSLMAENWFEYR